ncbi:allantoate amidohydrolase [Herbiconiux ginsengi]|uniref:N-carbamoyl-L-amino-acid hydrolase n=1 Tax=Herbiconiux ginsengi TaxID=381665 RepID=A0A1H3SS43_9MICO|nr:allantoate amidohydrolase [Herbiconiux ginsengi]SDZ40774.1 N-carbamoyl-L-amino-acid hydrolase [Herbiconiux ginsengi]
MSDTDAGSGSGAGQPAGGAGGVPGGPDTRGDMGRLGARGVGGRPAGGAGAPGGTDRGGLADGRAHAGETAHGRLAGLDAIAGVGADVARGGFSRHLWNGADLELRAWFTERAGAVGLDVEADRNGNLWAWWGAPGPGAVVTGSHLDSVPGGGAYDGPLGVVSALDAVGRLRASGFQPSKPFAVVVFAEEEGSRFGVACLGSRLMTGVLDPARARSLRDADGVTLAEAGAAVGFDVKGLGADPVALDRIGLFVELHVEQGRGLIDLQAPVALASSVLAHGRWRLEFRGQGNHAGTTLMGDRHDPMIAAARAVEAVRAAALAVPGARATVGRIEAVPGGTNVIASAVRLWLDARADSDDDTRMLVTEIERRAEAASFVEESWSGRVEFDTDLRERLRAVLTRPAAGDATGGAGDASVAGPVSIPVLATGAGHDAGVLAGVVPTAMLFVRNPTGVSHAPEEFAELADCLAGTDALESVLRGLL